MALLARYLDLNALGASHSGSENDPWSVVDWQTAISTNQGYVIYTKGTIEDATNTIDVAFDTSGSVINYYLPWNPLINGPWRMNLSRHLATGASAFLRGGVFWLDNVDVTNGDYYFSTCYIKCRNFVRGSMKGCHLVASGNYQPVSLSTTINDSAIVALSYSTSVQHYNCISNTSSAPFPCTNYQYWLSPFYGHPDFDADKEAFRGLYYINNTAPYFLSYPPNPGTIPFTDFIPDNPLEVPANYDKEIWGDDRVGIGISTDCVQYVNLTGHTNITFPTYPIGSPLNPLDWQQWQILIYDYPILPHVFMMKGKNSDYTGTFNVSSSSHKYIAWRPDLNGPWAIRANGVSNCTISGGILISCSDPSDATFYDCQVTFNESVESVGTVTMKGCLVSVEGNFNPATAVLESSAFNVTGDIASSGSGTAVNCAFNKYTGNLVRTDCQINWVPPPFPEHWQPYEAFSTGLLYEGVTTPPQPGLIPYTGYETDLWGAPRNTIGTGYTMSVSSVGWVNSYPKIVEITAIGATFKVATDVNSTASFVIVPHGAAAPSTNQILAGQDANGNTVSVGFSGSVVTGPIESTLTASNLATNVDYDVYFVADKYTHDVQSSVVKFDLHTSGNIYFIDLNAPNNGTGTENNPLSMSDWQNILSAVTENTIFYMKGSVVSYEQVKFLNTNNPVQGLIYKSWDSINNGPWRISTNNTFLASNVTIADGILQSYGMMSNLNTKLFNMYLVFLQETQNFALETVKGCSIKVTNMLMHSGFTPIDCAFKVSTLQGNAENFINCAIDFITDVSANTSFTNCSTVHYNATQKKYENTVFIPNGGLTAAWPTWDAEEASFSVANMYPNVPVPPQPGISPYTNYEFDLWGKPRSGIGANSGGVVFPPVWMDLLPSLQSKDSNSGSFLVGIRSQGTCYAVAVPFESEAPTSAQVKAGKDARDKHTDNSNIVLQANVASVLTITGLKDTKNYDVYFVAESTIIQPFPVKIFYKFSSKKGNNFEGIVIAGDVDVITKIPKINSLYTDVSLPDMKNVKQK